MGAYLSEFLRPQVSLLRHWACTLNFYKLQRAGSPSLFLKMPLECIWILNASYIPVSDFQLRSYAKNLKKVYEEHYFKRGVNC